MKPISLKMEGFHSFSNEIIIDFELLMRRGIFGIFGPTGSGKSSILDGICFALYGDIPRGNRSKGEIINIGSNQLKVNFVFSVMKNGKNEKYTIERIIKKDSNGNSKYKLARCINNKDDEDIIIAESTTSVKQSIENIIGLTFDDFTRSVILPQGKFNEFLKLSPSDRGSMMERIFNLADYGEKLKNKIKEKKNEISFKLETLQRLRNEYEFKNITIDRIKLLEKTIKEEEQLLENLQKDLDNNKKIYEKNLEVIEIYSRYKKYNNDFNLLMEKFFEIKELKKIEKKYNDAKPIYKYIKEEDEYKKELINIKESYKNIIIDFEKIREEKDIIEKKYFDFENLFINEKPKLRERNKKLKEIIEKYSKLKEIEIKLENIDKKQKTIKEDIKIDNEYLNLKENEKNNIEKEIEILLKNIEKFTIENEYKEYLINTINIENRLLDLKEDLNQRNEEKIVLQNKKNDNKDFIEKNQIVMEDYRMQKDEYEKILSNISNIELIIEEKNKININIIEKKSILKEYREKIEKKENLINIIKEKDKLKINMEVKIEKYKDEIEKLEKEYKKLKNENENNLIHESLEEYRKKLIDGKECPLCGSIHHNLAQVRNEIRNPTDTNLGIEKLEKEIKLITKEINDINLQINIIINNSITYNNEINLLSKYTKEFIKKLEKEIEELEIEYNNKTKIIEINKPIFEKNKELIDNIKVKIQELNGLLETKKIINEENDKLILNSNDLIIKLEEKIEKHEKVINEVKEKYNIKSISESYNEVKEKTLIKEKNEKEIAEKNQQMKENIRVINEKIKKINEMKILERGNFEIIESLKSNIEKMKNEINKVESIDPKKEFDEIEKEIIYIEKNYYDTKNIKEKIEKELNEKKVKKSNIEILIKSSKENLENKFKIIEEEMKEFNFSTRKEVLDSISTVENILEISEIIEKFDKNKFTLEKNIEITLKELKGRTVNIEENNLINIKIKEDSFKRDELMKDIASKLQEFKVIKIDYEKLKEIEEEYKKIKDENTIYEDLSFIFKGNNFVKYMASNELRYVCFEASKYLKNITKERYALELDSDLNFIMRDDYSGGARRSIHTLSGGEVFLVSLCLALSLSNHVQLKGNSPLQCFFLDEGFGSLDQDLLDVVISSLEKIRNEKFSIGIISHVEELKQRIPVKLNVIPASENHGSRIEY